MELLLHAENRSDILTELTRLTTRPFVCHRGQSEPPGAHRAGDFQRGGTGKLPARSDKPTIVRRLCHLAHSWDDQIQKLAVRAIEDISGRKAALEQQDEKSPTRASSLNDRQAKLLLTRENRVLDKITDTLKVSQMRDGNVSLLRRLLDVNPLFCLHILQHGRLRRHLETLAIANNKEAESLLARCHAAVSLQQWSQVHTQQRLCKKLVAALQYLSHDRQQTQSMRRTCAEALQLLEPVNQFISPSGQRTPALVPLMVAGPRTSAPSDRSVGSVLIDYEKPGPYRARL